MNKIKEHDEFLNMLDQLTDGLRTVSRSLGESANQLEKVAEIHKAIRCLTLFQAETKNNTNYKD